MVFGYTGSVSDYVGLGGTFHVGGDTIGRVLSPPTSLVRGSNTNCPGCMRWGLENPTVGEESFGHTGLVRKGDRWPCSLRQPYHHLSDPVILWPVYF